MRNKIWNTPVIQRINNKVKTGATYFASAEYYGGTCYVNLDSTGPNSGTCFVSITYPTASFGSGSNSPDPGPGDQCSVTVTLSTSAFACS